MTQQSKSSTSLEQLCNHIISNYSENLQKHINLSTTYQQKIGKQGMKIVMETINWSIQRLNLNMYMIQNEGMQILIKNGQKWTQLRELLLQRNGIQCQGVKGIENAGWDNMMRVKLTKNNIKTKGFIEIVKAKWPFLQFLDLSHNQIGFQGAKYFKQTNWPNIKILVLNYNLITSEGVRQLSFIKMEKLEQLEMSNNKLDGKAMFYLSQMQLPNLKSLLLNRNQIGKYERKISQFGCFYLAKIKCKSLRYLHLFGNQITLNGIKTVVNSGKLAKGCFLEMMNNHFLYLQIKEEIQRLQIYSNQFK